MAQTGSRADVFTDVKETVKATVVPRTIAQSEQIARYFTEDLEKFIDESHINLMRELEIPSDYAQDTGEIIQMLFDDLSHMLRDSMIIGIHLLLGEPSVDPNTHTYPLRYHAEYTITPTGRDLRSGSGDKDKYSSQRINGYLAPPRSAWIGAKFSLLIDWNPTTSERRRTARRPEYWFDWTPKQDRFDASSLVRYREGGMAFDGANVVRRDESKSPGYA